jgi:hypothetical protein
MRPEDDMLANPGSLLLAYKLHLLITLSFERRYDQRGHSGEYQESRTFRCFPEAIRRVHESAFNVGIQDADDIDAYARTACRGGDVSFVFAASQRDYVH